MEHGLTRNRIISELTRSPHGALAEYLPIGRQAASQEPDFFAHLVAWNNARGQVRDAKVALPVVALTGTADKELRENALAHIALLDPRNFLRSTQFMKEALGTGTMSLARSLVEPYLRHREANPGRWERAALQHRRAMKELYARYRVKPSANADAILFKGEKRGVFKTVAELPNMDPRAAAAVILTKKIPFLVATSALGGKAKEPDFVMALIESMSGPEIINNTKMLERLGVNDNPALRAAYAAGLQRVTDSPKKVSTFKATRAAEVIGDTKLGEKLRNVQEKVIDKAGGPKGNWLVLADKSSSMHAAIGKAMEVAAVLARVVDGEINLIFFDTSPFRFNATGKTLEEIKTACRGVRANGGTCIGVGVQWAIENKLDVDGIAIVSDGGENGPMAFANRYPVLTKMLDKEPPVYFFRLRGDPDRLTPTMTQAGIDMQTFDVDNVDYYGLDAVVKTMRANRYSLGDEILATPLLKLSDVFGVVEKEAA